jgi:ribonucleoside-diphosphate reductase alpha chain
MPSYSNFQSNNQKNTKDRYDIYNKDFENPIQKVQEDFISNNIHKWTEFISFLRFYPDIAYDLIKPKEGKQLHFDLDQRVMLRCLVRFYNNYDCIPRGGSKTLLHIMAQYHVARFFPGISLSVMAPTKQSAVEIWEDKHNEIMDFYPSLKDEIKSANFSKDTGEVVWVNSSRVDALAMAQSSKGKRRRRGGLEESNLIVKDIFEDAVAPIFNVPRKTLGNIEDPTELNGQINRYTTSGYKNSDEYGVILNTFKDMVDLKGSYVFGADWRLPVHFGRQKMSVVNSARKASITRFKTNYLCEWIGSGDGALINVSKLLKCRTLGILDIEVPKDFKTKGELPEFIIGVDVARKVNNKTAIVVGKLIKSQNGNIRQIHIMEIVTPPQYLNLHHIYRIFFL